ncbi:MAG: YceI family protein [Bdellovibrionota bacterium]
MTTYALDPVHSSVGFSVKHMMISKVHGSFEKFSGKLQYDKNHAEKSFAEATIEAASIHTRESQRDEHLRSPDFFDTGQYPTLTFKSRLFTDAGQGELKVMGDLTIKGVTKQVMLDVEGPTDEIKDPYENIKIGLYAQTKINRKDFGLNWNAILEAGGVLVGEEVTITLDLQFIKTA